MSKFLFNKGKGKRSSKETSLGISRKYSLAPGRCYVIEEAPPSISFDAFTNMISSADEDGDKSIGLAITRQHPDMLKEKYGIEQTQIYWLAGRAGENVLSPTNLGILTHTIIKFIEDNKNGTILLDGLEYLVSNNDFNKVLRVIDQINDHISQSTSRLILPVDPRAFESKELALLERNMEKIVARATG